jgi:ATP-dependent DNA helicase 2 subunit 2
MRKDLIRFDVYGIGFDLDASDDAPPVGGVGDARAAAQANTRSALRRLQAAVDAPLADGSDAGPSLVGFTKLSDAISMLEALKKKSMKSSTSFRGCLQIGGSLGLPVWSWRKVVTAGAPTMKSVSKAALEEAEGEESFDPAQTVSTERRHFVQSAPDQDVPPNLSVSGFRFGKDVIPISSTDAERIKDAVETKQLRLLGVIPQQQLPRHLLTARAECVVADADSVGPAAAKALQALILALEEEEAVAVARYAPKKGASPTLVSLWPAVRCLWMVPIPFEDEMRSFDWGPPSSTAPPSEAQLAAAGKLVDAMELCPEAGDDGRGGSGSAARIPKHVYNPKLQRFYQCIQSRALAMLASDDPSSAAGSTALPNTDWRVTAPFSPDEQMLARASAAIDAFAALCPLEDSSSSGAKRARVGADAAGAPNKRTHSEASLPGGGGVGGGVLKLTHTAPTSIDSADPITSFWAITENPANDLSVVENAIKEMCDTVHRLLSSCASATDGLADKGCAALRELRRGSIMFDSPTLFNELLRALKTSFAGGPRSEVWERIVRDVELGAGLITRKDLPEESEVTEEAAAIFWTVADAATAQPVPLSQPADEEENDYLDDLE